MKVLKHETFISSRGKHQIKCNNPFLFHEINNTRAASIAASPAFDPPNESEVLWNDVIPSGPGDEWETVGLKQLYSSAWQSYFRLSFWTWKSEPQEQTTVAFFVVFFFMCCRHCVLKEPKTKTARKEVVPNKGTERLGHLWGVVG